MAERDAAEAPQAPAAGRRKRVAVVVGSGGLKCAAALGMWKVLERAGIQPDVVVGCSGGAIYAAAMALGVPLARAERDSLHMWQGLFGRRRYGPLVGSLLFGRPVRSEHLGLFDDRLLNTRLRQIFGDATFADARIPLFLASTDVHSGERHTIGAGPVFDAIRASVAIPLLLPPWQADGRLLMDGGASDPLPISVAIREGAEIILAMGFEVPIAAAAGSVLQVAQRTMATTVNQLLRSTYAFYSAVHHAEIIPLMPEFEQPVRLGDTHLIPRLIELGERVTEAELPYLQRLLAARTPPPPPADGHADPGREEGTGARPLRRA